ncbi:hypothetical protein P4S52_15785 [Vibrio sp. SA48]|jgi:hypothetical protein|uniref:hypothetical protein n=1 Tax=Vibrio TaxID=662 RepID=UPI0006A5B55D|nr:MULTISPECIES: hypothetical protein [Vibrio]KOE80325.1 hypothetical protein ACS86_17525 [Vibrio alginolyticus]CAH8189415.1 conserved hypothetical protein [Vibrio aestuarianus]MBF4258673.1 hypothetical protein [Vibrio anguillarum]MBF4440969.1 hypothetical protein [Vibrio anguillarum]POB90446.1 hypothetical protein CRN40_00420 [Vibrio vulnificus]
MSNPASLVWSALSSIYGVFADKSASERNYKVIVPAVQLAIEGGAKYEDDYIQASVEALKALAPYGARREKFYKYYLMDIDGLSRLPKNPSSLSIAYWW